MHEWALWSGLDGYLESAPRDSLLSMNREGVFGLTGRGPPNPAPHTGYPCPDCTCTPVDDSLLATAAAPGFLALFLVGGALARTVALPPSRRLRVLAPVAAACMIVHQGLGGAPATSRRLMNSAYVVWVVGYCVVLLLAGAVVEVLQPPGPPINLFSLVSDRSLSVFLGVGA